MQKPLKISEINTDNIVYTKIKKSRNNRIIYIKYQDNNKLKNFVFQSPSLLSVFSPIKQENYYDIDFNLDFKDTDKGNLFINFLESIDKKIIYDASINSHLWFDSLDIENKEVLHKSIIREDEECKNGVLKLNIVKTPEFETILKLDQKRININDIKDNLWCKMILECYAILISNDLKLSLYIRPIILSFKTIEVINYNYDFYDESDDDVDSDVNNLFIKKIDLPNEIKEEEIKDYISSTTSDD